MTIIHRLFTYVHFGGAGINEVNLWKSSPVPQPGPHKCALAVGADWAFERRWD